MSEIDINSLDAFTDDSDPDEVRLNVELQNWFAHPGDKLFEKTPGAARVDPLGQSSYGEPRSPVGRFSLYCEAYLQAGDRLVDGWEGYPAEDSLIYPVVFLYRHHLELKLKEIAYSCPERLSSLTTEDIERKRSSLTDKHSLKAIWDVIKSIHPECNDWTAGEAPEAPQAFERLIDEFDEHDPASQSARYSEDKKGKQTLLKLTVVDLRILRTRVHQMTHYLSAIEEVYLQDRSEMSV